MVWYPTATPLRSGWTWGQGYLEGTVGAVPIAGDAFDIYFRANRRNVALLRKYFRREGF